MIMFRRILAVLVLICATQVHADVVEGRDYKLLNPPQPTSRAARWKWWSSSFTNARIATTCMVP